MTPPRSAASGADSPGPWSALSPGAWSRRAVDDFGVEGELSLHVETAALASENDGFRWPWPCNQPEVCSRCYLREAAPGVWSSRVLLAAHPGRLYQFLTVEPCGRCEMVDLLPGIFDVVWVGSFDELAPEHLPLESISDFVRVPGDGS